MDVTAPGHDRCRVCSGPCLFAFKQRVRGHAVSYFDCAACGYFQTESPFWLEEAYSSAINDVDTGILWRNQVNVRRVIMTLAAFGRLSGQVIDHAGGYGILVRLLRDAGVDAFWQDKYCQNLLARGFEATDSKVDLLTAFEVFEHLVEPLVELKYMLEQAPVVLLSTELAPKTAPPRPDWWYLGPEHGQHIGFFRSQTLEWMAQQLGCHCESYGRSLHAFSRTPIPLRWKTLQRMQSTAPMLAALTLKSRTMTDFDLMRKAQR